MSKFRCEPGWIFLLPALVVPTMGALFYFVLAPDGAAGKAAYTMTKLFTLIYPFLFLRWIGVGGILRRCRHAPRIQWPRWREVLGSGLASGLVIAAAGLVLMQTSLGDLVREGAAAVSEKAEGMGFKEHFLRFAIFLSVVHSALEEFYWRWFCYGQIRRRMSRWAAHVVAAVAFGGHHLIITLQFFPVPFALFLTTCVVVGGFIWTLMYERQGTVIGCWVSHICVDVMLMIIGFRLIMGA